MSGDIREYRKTLDIDGRTLVKYSQKIENAFKYYAERQQVTKKDRQTECIYITGKSGSGKTTLARKIAENRGLAYFVSSGSNDVMDGYCQEPVLILDDVRPECMQLSDFFKMLDPHVASSVKSRYKNKYLNCELVILTSILKTDEFVEKSNKIHNRNGGSDLLGQNNSDADKEPVEQLNRRCQIYCEMDKDIIKISLWDKNRMKYSNPVYFKNTILDAYIPNEKTTAEDVRTHVKELMPFLEEDTLDLDVGGFHLEPVREDKISTKKQKADSKDTTSISNANFDAIMPKL